MKPPQIPAWLAVPAGALVLLLRMPDRFLHPQFYAEDAYFYECALTSGAKSLVQPYGGYLLMIQRLASWFATGLPPLHVPAFFNAVALGLVLLVLVRLFSRRAALPRPALLGLALVLFPRVEDIFLTFENLQWIMALGLVLLLVSADAATLREKTADGASAVLFGLTGVFSVILLPLFLCRALQRNTRASWLLAALIAATAGVQAVEVLLAPPYRLADPAPFILATVPAVFGLHLFGHLFAGDWLEACSPFALGLVGALWFLFLARGWSPPGQAVALRRTRRYFFGALCLVGLASIYRFKNELDAFQAPIDLERYFFVPEVLCLWLLLTEIPAPPVRRWGLAVLAAGFLVTSARFFRVEPLENDAWARYAPLLRGSQPIDVPINPPGWHFHYPGRPAPAAPPAG